MAEQKSIVLTAIILAMIVAGASFYYFTASSSEEQLNEANDEAQGEVVIGDELAAKLNGEEAVQSEEVTENKENILPLAEEQIDEKVDGITSNEGVVLGTETVEPTAETGTSGAVMLLMGFMITVGFTGLVVTLRKQRIGVK
jgi:hypothetical protein